MKTESSNSSPTPEDIIEEQLQKFRRKRDAHGFLKTIVIVFIACFVLFGILFGIGRVNGDSMNPTLHDRDFVLLWRPGQNYMRGDIVFFQKEGESKELVKRVIGTPGDSLDIRNDGEVILNGSILAEDYIFVPTYADQAQVSFPIELKEGEYFVMGDNRINSRDSRVFGIVKKGEIDGKVIFIARGKLN